MVKKKYRFTKAAKVAGVQLFICLIGLVVGFVWEIHDQNERWDKLIYPGVKVADVDLSGKTKEQGIRLVESNYIDLLFKEGINVIVNDKTYAMDCSKLISDYDVESAVDKAIIAGKSLSFFNKYQIIKQGISNSYNITYEYDDNYLRDFISIIERDINREPVDASITATPEGNVKVTDDILGYKLQVEKLEVYIKDNIESGSLDDIILEAPVEEITALITSDKLNPIDKKLASFSTSFASFSNARAHNIGLAAKAINGSILMPGEIFSFNDYIGEISKKKGFVVAPVLEDGNYKPGVGGGICQVSTTLYRTALDSGLKIIERSKHGLPSSYIGLGLDATVYWGSIDLKFQNILEYPMLIEAYTDKKSLYINMYSNSNLANRTYAVKNNVYMKIPAATKIIDDPDLPLGETVVFKKGADGYKVKVTRETYEEGKLINSEVISNDYYKPVDEIIKKGIKNDA